MSDDERSIRDLVQTWMKATQAGDADTVLSLMDDDIVFMVPGQEPFGKDVFSFAAEQMKDMRMSGSCDIRELKIIGDWAFLRNYIDVTIRPPIGNAMHRCGYTLSILRKQADGKWLLWRDANMVA